MKNLAVAVVARLPLWLLRSLARAVAWAILLTPWLKINRVVDTNLQLAYPALSDKQRRLRRRRVIVNQCLSSVESIKSWTMPPKWSVDAISAVHRQAVLDCALKNPNGMLAIVPHLGTWEVMNAWLNQFGSPTIMYKPIKGDTANALVLQGRQRLNATLVPTDASGVKAIFKTLKNGGFSILLPDHVPEPSGGVIAPFFGVPTLSGTLAPKLAQKTRCALVGLACVRQKNGKGFEVFCYDLGDPNLYDKDTQIAAAALNQALQSIIDKHSDYYMWGYKRFKFVPNVDNVYNLTAAQVRDLSQRFHTNSKATP